MKDRRPTKVLENGAVRYGIYDEAGTLLRYEFIRPEDEPTQIGTPLTKMTLLSDETAGAIGLEQEDPTVNDALAGLAAGKQDGLTGQKGQFLGFDWDGKPLPQDLPETGVGRSMAGQTVEPTQGTTVTAGAGAEVFNDYRARTFGTPDQGYETVLPTAGNIASGINAHAEGNQTTASGFGAHAEGNQTTASGSCSHAEGGRYTGDVGCIASGYGAHAEGVTTKASNSGAHSEGRGTKAEGIGAHSEGQSTTASKDRSHAEGYSTTAGGFNAHAEGNTTQATGQNSHAEGYAGIAEGSASHVEGGQVTDKAVNKASGYAAHAEGASTLASGGQSHAEGQETTASGNNSHAEGYLTQATAAYAHAEGYGALASAPASHAEGVDTKAKGDWGNHAEGHSTETAGHYSHAEGGETKATANYSHAEGEQTIASGEASHAEGRSTTASGINAHAEGNGTKAAANYSHAEGFMTTASGTGSHAGGLYSAASGTWSFAHGSHLTADYYQIVFGEYNAPNTHAGEFILGCGSDSARSNSFRADTAGVYSIGPYNSSGADYAELFEWADGNPDHADRVGRFVTLDGAKIRLAGPGDSYILGIVSGAPSVVGDVYDDQWQGMYLTDIFGRPVWEDVEVPAVTEEVPVTGPAMDANGEAIENSLTTHMETRVVIPAHTERRQKLNPNYDNGQKYVPRTQRPEWAAVGLLGKLVAVEDGTCQAGGYCAPGEDGAATASEDRTPYRVMEKLTDPETGMRCVRVMILPGA